MSEPLTTYQKKLFLFLGVATFFEGFDHMAMAQLLPSIRADMLLPNFIYNSKLYRLNLLLFWDYQVLRNF